MGKSNGKSEQFDFQGALLAFQVVMNQDGGATEKQVQMILDKVPAPQRPHVLSHVAGKWDGAGNSRRFVYRGKTPTLRALTFHPSIKPIVEFPSPPSLNGDMEGAFNFVRGLMAKHQNGISEHEFWFHIKNHLRREPTGYEKQRLIPAARVFKKDGKYYPVQNMAVATKAASSPVQTINPAAMLNNVQTIHVMADELQTKQGGEISAMMRFQKGVKLVIQVFGGKKE